MGRSDLFSRTMHPRERSLRMGVSHRVSEMEYLEYVSQQVLEWTDADCDFLAEALESVDRILIESDFRVQEPFTLIKTSGKDEWNSPYTRQSAVILPKPRLRKFAAPREMVRLLLHEYFHILSRNNPEIRTALYELLGFYPMDAKSVPIPEDLRGQMITNPDAPCRNHFLTVSTGTSKTDSVPVIFLKEGLSTINISNDIARSIQIRLLPVNNRGGSWTVTRDDHDQITVLNPGNGVVLNPVLSHQLPFFAEPEEMMAEMFVALLMNNRDGSNPLLNAMSAVLTSR